MAEERSRETIGMKDSSASAMPGIRVRMICASLDRATPSLSAASRGDHEVKPADRAR